MKCMNIIDKTSNNNLIIFNDFYLRVSMILMLPAKDKT